jgi:hypothetical protein
MSIEQRETLDAILRQAALPPDASVDDQRRVLREFLPAQPPPARHRRPGHRMFPVASRRRTNVD